MWVSINKRKIISNSINFRKINLSDNSNNVDHNILKIQ